MEDPQSKDDMKDLKSKRSKYKASVTTSATRLLTGINRGFERKIIEAYDVELETAYIDFIVVDVKYARGVEDHEEWKEEFNVVNTLDCSAYTQAVEQIYNEARQCYDQYVLNKTKASYEEIHDTLTKLWQKIEKENDANQVQKELKRVETLSAQISALKEKDATINQ